METVLNLLVDFFHWLFSPKTPATKPTPPMSMPVESDVGAVADAVGDGLTLAKQVDAELNNPARIAAIQAGAREDNTDALLAAKAAVNANPNDPAAQAALRKLLP
jgi:hypothetical protein